MKCRWIPTTWRWWSRSTRRSQGGRRFWPASPRLGGARLHQAAERYVARISELVGVPLALISVGPGRDETIVRDNPFVARNVS